MVLYAWVLERLTKYYYIQGQHRHTPLHEAADPTLFLPSEVTATEYQNTSEAGQLKHEVTYRVTTKSMLVSSLKENRTEIIIKDKMSRLVIPTFICPKITLKLFTWMLDWQAV